MIFLILVVLVLAIALVLGSYAIKRFDQKCPKLTILNVPAVQTFVEEQEAAPSVMAQYSGMFWKISPWDAIHPQSVYLQRGLKQPHILGGRPKSQLAGGTNNRDDYLTGTTN